MREGGTTGIVGPEAPPERRHLSWVVRITAVLVVALLLTTVFAVLQPSAVQALSASGCSYTPMTSSWLSQQGSVWASATPLPMATAAVLMAASYGNPERSGSSLAAIEADLAMLRSAGAQVIRIDLNYQPWLENDTRLIAQMDRVIASIRADGLGLMIADSASETYWHHPLTWPAFDAAAVLRVGTIAARYHPDYYVVVKEPGWYYHMFQGFPLNPAVESATAWADLTQALVSAVRTVSPPTQIGVAVAASTLYGRRASPSRAYLGRARQLPGLDFLGFDVYGVCDFENTIRFLQEQGTGDKQIWVPEAWSEAGSGVYDPGRSSLDLVWANVLYEFLATIRARGVGLFYTDVLAAYEPPPANASALLAYYSGLTSAFYEIQNLTAASRRLGFPVAVMTSPSGCGPVDVNGTGIPSGGSLTSPVQELSLAASACPGRSFAAWSTRGDVRVAASTDPNTTLEVLGPGALTGVYASSPDVGVAIGIAPDACASSKIGIEGQSLGAGSGVSLTPGTYHLIATACAGLPVLAWRTTGSVSVGPEGTLSVRGVGTLEAVFLPAPPPAEVLSLPADQAAVVLASVLAAVVGVPLLLAWDATRLRRARRRTATKGSAAPAEAKKRTAWPVRWAYVGFAAQIAVAVVFVLSSILLWSYGYVIEGDAGTGFFLMGILVDVLVVLLLYLAWTRSVAALRRGEYARALRPTFWLGLVELGAGLVVVGTLYLLAFASARKAGSRDPRSPHRRL